MSASLHIMILIPFIFAIAVPYIYKQLTPRIHTGWFVLFIPLVIFVYLLSFIPKISEGNTFRETVPWIPAYNINFTTYMDGLSLLFGLIITGIGALVILYS
ncbi:Na+/H+ antiporter subunit A, partial [Neobacillus vireti]